MEGDFFRAAPVNFAFRFGNDRKNCKRTIFDSRAQVGQFDNFFYVAERPMAVTFGVLVAMQSANVRSVEFRIKICGKLHIDIGRADSVLAYVGNVHVEFVRQFEFVEFPAQKFFRNAQLQTRAQEHVAAYARRAV